MDTFLYITGKQDSEEEKFTQKTAIVNMYCNPDKVGHQDMNHLSSHQR